jgi:hypothetical protein
LPTDAKLAIRLHSARSIAQERGGRFLSDTLANNRDKAQWECAKGHRWGASLTNVKNGTWCPRCSSRIPTIEDMQRLASERGGTCLSPAYVNKRTPLEWRCAEHHVWRTTPGNIRYHWCPYCSKTPRLALRDIRKAARMQGVPHLRKARAAREAARLPHDRRHAGCRAPTGRRVCLRVLCELSDETEMALRQGA